mmetsp:Transcript_19299/g.51550  ORF Transcript_19299/g.51550 Transcript_19299/m.51550 type:complete len:296 (+) Transcript_19299:1523-2410(+)
MAIRLDQASEGVRAHNCDAPAPMQKLQLFAEKVFLPNPHARFNNRGEQDLVHVFLHGADQLHGLFDLALRGLAVERLQENRTRDLVGWHSSVPHLRNHLPEVSLSALSGPRHHGVQQFVESHTIWLQAFFLHLLHEGTSLVEPIAKKIGLHDGVEGHHVRHARSLHFLHPLLGGWQVLAFHARIQHRVVDDTVHLKSAGLQTLTNTFRSTEVPLGRATSNHRHVLGHVSRRSIQQLLRQIMSATLKRRVHEHPLKPLGSPKRRRQNRTRLPSEFALVKIASPCVLLTLNIEPDES